MVVAVYVVAVVVVGVVVVVPACFACLFVIDPFLRLLALLCSHLCPRLFECLCDFGHPSVSPVPSNSWPPDSRMHASTL